jgi:hypothetical protein
MDGSKMTKKDYIKLAETLKYCKPSKIAKPKGFKDRLEAWEGITEQIALTLQEDNSQFNKNKFLTACGYLPE